MSISADTSDKNTHAQDDGRVTASAVSEPGPAATGPAPGPTYNGAMNVTIFLADIARELNFKVQGTQAEIEKAVNDALADGTALRLLGEDERVLVVNPARIGAVLVGEPEQRQVGFSLS